MNFQGIVSQAMKSIQSTQYSSNGMHLPSPLTTNSNSNSNNDSSLKNLSFPTSSSSTNPLPFQLERDSNIRSSPPLCASTTSTSPNNNSSSSSNTSSLPDATPFPGFPSREADPNSYSSFSLTSSN